MKHDTSKIKYIDCDNKTFKFNIYWIFYRSGKIKTFTSKSIPKTAKKFINTCTNMYNVKIPAIDKNNNVYELNYIRIV